MNTEKFSLIKGIATTNELTCLETCHKNFVLSHNAELWLTDNDHRRTNRGPRVDSPNYIRHVCKHLYFPGSCTCKQALGDGKNSPVSETGRNVDPRSTCNYDFTKSCARMLP